MVKKKLELRLSCKLRAREEEEQHGTVSTFIKRIEEKKRSPPRPRHSRQGGIPTDREDGCTQMNEKCVKKTVDVFIKVKKVVVKVGMLM